MASDDKTVILSDELVATLKKRVDGSEFKSISEYVNHILKQVVAKIEKKEQEKDSDEEQVKSKLKALGYV